MKSLSILALAAPVAAFTSQNSATRQSTQLSETKVRCAILVLLCLKGSLGSLQPQCQSETRSVVLTNIQPQLLSVFSITRNAMQLDSV